MSTEASRLIRRARTDAGLSLKQLSSRSRIAESTLSLYENGHRRPSFDAVMRILRACGMTFSVKPAVRDPQQTSAILEQVCGMALELPRAPKPPPPTFSELVGS